MGQRKKVMAKWFAENSMKANADKFQGNILPGSRENKDVQISLGPGEGGGGGHSHQLPYGGVPLYRVDFERPVSLKYGVILSNFPKK